MARNFCTILLHHGLETSVRNSSKQDVILVSLSLLPFWILLDFFILVKQEGIKVILDLPIYQYFQQDEEVL
ncbi:hypothetical protein CSA56_12285 [candidate division KSB3 bacterium]|uniref:Uncharacterized protein n=1 Tax=candidate division KSB3 bacterium TaxID=2044937 RepID=A0A2G6KEF4_9BACT|nr:MAG: hypothetical protein CSA56_12285 [candidate division KSB3 bacterium]